MQWRFSNDRSADDVEHALLLTAYRESSRLDRLSRLVGVLAATQPHALRRIGRLHDHKGTLFVVWLEWPEEEDVATVKQAWELFSEPDVMHGVGTMDADPYKICNRELPDPDPFK